MKGRCKICGAPSGNVTICNYCAITSEERRFLRMVNREEVKSTRAMMDRRLKKKPPEETVTK